ncbi:MAG: NAD+ synthase [Chlamydiales bacterium]|nr:NAD+ synthase [Chlamydiales bacterium]
MKVHLSQLNPVIGDLDGNTQKILNAIAKSRDEKADIVLFPELSICGYPPQDLVYHPAFIDAMEKHLQTIVQASKGLMVVVGLVRPNLGPGENGLSNSAAIAIDGKLIGFHDKWLLPNYDVFNERRYFDPGNTLQTFDYKGKKIGILICEDIWQHAGYVAVRYGRDPVIEMAKLKPDLILNLSASPYNFGKADIRVEVCAKVTTTCNCPIVYCAQVGGNDSLLFDGYSVYVDAEGKLRQLAKGFVEDHMVIDLEAQACACPFKYDMMSDLYNALVMGVRDYFHKSGFKKACLGLSGGLDSALVACIVASALGPENLLAVSMPSRYTSDLSKTDAKKLADTLGIKLISVPIEEPFCSYLELLAPLFQNRAPDVTEENLQARIRGVILMAISNKLGYIVVSTGNKSEFALGYSTLYGDSCGGLGVIGDVTKTRAYDLCRWINRDKEIIPTTTIDRAPTAELRANQHDQQTLPPYGIVDQVIQSYLEEFMPVSSISEKHNIPLDLVKDLVHRIHTAEYKRRQSPPVLRVTPKSFGVGRHFPIVQTWK